MEKKSKLGLWLLVFIFATGIFTGSLYQVKIDAQTEMYEYLKEGVTAYNPGLWDGIKAVFSDNFPELCILLVSAFLPFGAVLTGGVLASRGFMTGFAITAAMRTYGIKGMGLCLGNIVSCAVLVPSLIMFGLLLSGDLHKKNRLRTFMFSALFLMLMLGLDAVIRGGFSVVMSRLWN